MNERKVRKDFDSSKEYTVNVSDCTDEEKKEVQQAFFDVGILWDNCGSAYQLLNALQYTNATSGGNITTRLMFAYTPEGCNMSAEEFLDLVYEPEQQGHIHAELMTQFAEDAKTHAEPWKLWQIHWEGDEWRELGGIPMWISGSKYRRKPKTHIVNGVEIPDLRVSPECGEHYYLADPTALKLSACYKFTGELAAERIWVVRGLTYQNTEEGKQAAILHAKAMLGINSNE